MGTFSLDTTRVDPGTLVLSISPTTLLMLDDGQGQVDQSVTSQLMATVAGGDRAAVLAALRTHRESYAAGVAVVATPDRVSAFAFGPLVLVAETSGARITIAGYGHQLDEIPLPSTLTSLIVTPEGSIPLRNGEGAAPASTAVRASRLRVDLIPVSAPPTAPTPPTTPVPPAPVAAVTPPTPSTPAPVEPPAPVDDRPQVLGVRCPRDHHNHPDAVYCAQCGLRMGVNQTIIAGMGPRPSIGVLLLDDGTTHSIDTDMIVGREPQFHAAVVAGQVEPVIVLDQELNLSREHFSIRLDGWDVMVMDLNSSNGTYLMRHNTPVWEQISATHETAVSAGDRLRAGARVFQIQLHHIQT